MSDENSVPHADSSAPPEGNALQLASHAARQGASDAYDAANRAWASTSMFLSRFTYTTCYTISYGVVFPISYVAMAVPKDNALVRGMIDGAHSARAQVDKVLGKAGEEAIPAPMGA
ncbi:MAG: hypothetical protein U0800_10760 [Isosphaeraceae bacterium]